MITALLVWFNDYGFARMVEGAWLLWSEVLFDCKIILKSGGSASCCEQPCTANHLQVLPTSTLVILVGCH